MPVLLEVPCGSIEDMQIAMAGGAQRIELCSVLEQGGLTPSPDVILQARRCCPLPVFVMIRPRSGGFCFTDSEFSDMESAIDFCRDHKMDGIVTGILTADGRIDTFRTRQLVERAGPLPVTFHRAFDQAIGYPESLEKVIETGCRRLLTSGLRPSATEGLPQILEMVSISKGRIIILPGGNVSFQNAKLILSQNGLNEIHASCKNPLIRDQVHPDPDLVRRLTAILRTIN